MTEENTEVVVVPKDEQQAKGAPPGVRNKDISEGHSGDGPKAPVISNEPPVKVPTAEEKAVADKKVADDKVIADKAAADAAAADPAKVAADKAAADADAEAAKLGEYTKYDDVAADSVVDILKESGVSVEDAKKFFEKATTTGKVEDIDVSAIEAKLGKSKTALLMMGVQQYVNTTMTKNVEITKVTHAAVGGPENFKKVSEWAAGKEKADPAFKAKLDEYRKMFGTGPTGAAMASKALGEAYNASPENSSLKVTMIQGDKTVNAAAITGISRADYLSQLKVAQDKRDNTEVARLHAARLAGKKAGI